MAKTMTYERYGELNDKGYGITEEEAASGWHFCVDWDGLLRTKDQHCGCELAAFQTGEVGNVE